MSDGLGTGAPLPDSALGNTGIFSGADGKPSGRRIFGTVFLFASGVSVFIAQFQGLTELVQLAPAGLLAVVGLFLWGFVTVQNLKELAGK